MKISASVILTGRRWLAARTQYHVCDVERMATTSGSLLMEWLFDPAPLRHFLSSEIVEDERQLDVMFHHR